MTVSRFGPVMEIAFAKPRLSEDRAPACIRERTMKHAIVALTVFAAVASNAASADVITDWNETTRAVMKAANSGGNPASRALAMVHVAMADAVNSVQDRYTRYVASVPKSPG